MVAFSLYSGKYNWKNVKVLELGCKKDKDLEITVANTVMTTALMVIDGGDMMAIRRRLQWRTW
jgi:hypothetical protein